MWAKLVCKARTTVNRAMHMTTSHHQCQVLEATLAKYLIYVEKHDEDDIVTLTQSNLRLSV